MSFIIDELFAGASSTTTAESTIITPSTGSKFRLKAITMCAVTTASTVTFKDGTAGTTVLTIRCPADTPVTLSGGLGGLLGENGIHSATKDNLLTATNGTSTTVVMSVRYVND